MSWLRDIRVVVGLDFGTTYSGFTYCHVENSKDIRTNDKWPGEVNLKTNTVLQYDSNFRNVVAWGHAALSKRPNQRNRNETRPVELFKLYLGKLKEDLRPRLPVQLGSDGYKKAITDYLRELGVKIKEVVEKWGVDFTENVLFVFTVPAEYSEIDQDIMRRCAHQANFIKDKDSPKLQFTTEPEAAAIYCMESKLQEYDLLNAGTTFMIVDCGGGTVDLTTRKLNGIKPLQLGEVTERTGDFCGSTFIDRLFINFLQEKLGTRPIELLIENHYGQLQYMIQEFCRRVKEPFTGDNTGFRYDLDIEENAPVLLQYVSRETREIMEENEWIIEITYDDVKSWFDPIIKRIINMIRIQLFNSRNNEETCSAMFLVGGFSESKYLQKRIKQEFQDEVKIIPPNQPIAAIVRGAAMYGLSLKNSSNAHKMDKLKRHVIHSRTLKFTYGIKILGKWKNDFHPFSRRVFDDKIYLFETFVKRGTKVEVDKEFPKCGYKPLTQSQKALKFELYKTPKHDAIYHDEDEMELVGILRILLPNGFDNKVTFGFSFGQMEITAFAKNELNGQNFQTKFDVNEL
ncbi:hypothetical protein RclHR1_07890003 [Rhizophagus clarus]|uniref:Actin-like ATPase domain-containing protein n=1 Tax=Rhizophagus clarus TaxID=94130 RepID=A0A2Z6RYP7_9GLOM|nr:hypothetical protein RclHR1_07890003 [Rhizophagus clarus]GES97230.1 hypothetical protein GLOIN_2v1678578 [Rhizophagus clarus]